MMIRLLAPAAAALLIAGCGSRSEPRDDTGNNAAANQAAPAPEPAPAAEAVRPKAEQQAQRPSLTLAADGLAVADPAGSSRTIAFGTARQQVLDRVAPALGAPTTRSDNEECPAGAMHIVTWRDRISLNFQEGRFVGWALEGDAPSEYSTAGGISLGSTRAELERAHETNVQEGSLGWEFGAGELYGVLSGSEPNARVEALWAGTGCIFH